MPRPRRASPNRPQHVLETAAGTGVLTRAMAAQLAADGAHRRHRSQSADARSGKTQRQSGDSRIEWRQADALALPFEDRKLRCGGLPVRRDVLSRQDPGLRGSAARAETGRPFLFNVWDRISENEFADV